MTGDTRRVLEIILDELAQVLDLGADAVERCRQHLAELIRPRWPVLFLATGDRPPCEATIHSFRTLVAQGVEPTLVRSHSFAQIWTARDIDARLGCARILDERDAEEESRLAEGFPLLCVLTLSDNTVAKTTLGLRDAVAPRLLRAFLDRGRPVVAAGLPPQRMELNEGDGFFWNLPLSVRQWTSRGYRTLEQWGVEFVQPEQLARAVRRHLFGLPEPAAQGKPPAKQTAETGRVFITVDDIRAARVRGERTLAPPPNAIVTDEAREFAARWGIHLAE